MVASTIEVAVFGPVATRDSMIAISRVVLAVAG
jgi:hypothetical protein